ncbi:hypothetical protein RI129_000652 [Pyrocoelia pectoralis]|uniref:4-coumarate--CoA ligase n=1 Tax=Pyrocoelia pectoralis TaxID=417401 RepID=A0AAN7VTE1_9COLE
MISLIRKILHQKVAFIFKQKLHSAITGLEIPNLCLETTIWRNLDKWQDKTALVCSVTNRSYTYLELYNNANSLANFSYQFRSSKCDVAVVVLPNMPEFAIILLGLVRAGFVVTTLNPSFTAGEMCRQFANVDAKLVFTTSEAYRTVIKTLQLMKLQVPVVTVETQGGALLNHDTIDFKNVIQQSSSNIQFNVERNHEDTVIMPFTSGTTGYPKGIELTHKNMVSCLYQMSTKEFDIVSETNGSDQDVIPVILPMYHLYGMAILLLHGLLKGCKLVIVPKISSQILISILERHKPTVIYLVPPIFGMLLNNNCVGRSHFATVKYILSGGACLGYSDIVALQDKVGGHVNVVQAYGLTESSSMSHSQSARLKNGIKPGGAGFLLPLTEGKIISHEDEKELAHYQVGEILLRGPQIMKGYYNNENANREAFTCDGWFKTGDTGYCDEDGHFFITGRLKEIIKVKGFQVAPAELEELIRQHPDVEDVAVIGVPHHLFGESPKAFVVRKRDSNVTTFEIEEFVKKNVVKYKQLSGGVVFTESIPKSPSGKILRKLLVNT